MMFFFSFAGKSPRENSPHNDPAVPSVYSAVILRERVFENVLELEPRPGVILKKFLPLKILF